MPRTAFVVGATGAQGAPVARALLDAGWRVLAATRSGREVPGAEAVRVDVTDAAALEAAAKGAEAAFWHQPLSAGGPGADERAALRALLAAGVEHVVVNAGFALPPEPVGVPPLDARIALMDELLGEGRTTLLVPTGYLENFSAPWSRPRVAAGELVYPLPADALVSWVTNDDLAAAAVAAFDVPEARGARLAMAGPEALTLPEVAERLGRAVGREVAFRRVSGSEYAEVLAPVLGPETAGMIGAGYDRMPPGPNPLMTPDTSLARTLLAVEPTSVEDWARRQDWAA